MTCTYVYVYVHACMYVYASFYAYTAVVLLALKSLSQSFLSLVSNLHKQH